MDWLALFQNLAGYGWLATAMGGVATFFWKVKADQRDGNLKRFEKFQQMVAYTKEAGFKKVKLLVNPISTEPSVPPSEDEKFDFMAFYEQLALIVQSGLMQEDVAFYMFGEYAIRAYYSAEFWKGIESARDDRFWGLFRDFCLRMEVIDKRHNDKIAVRKFRF